MLKNTVTQSQNNSLNNVTWYARPGCTCLHFINRLEFPGTFGKQSIPVTNIEYDSALKLKHWEIPNEVCF